MVARADTYGPYRMEVVRTIDGDTVVAEVEIWPGQTMTTSVRIRGVDTPEKRTKDKCEKDAANAATEFTIAFHLGRECRLVDVELGKFAGRVIGDLECGGELLSEALLASGHGHRYGSARVSDWCAVQ